MWICVFTFLNVQISFVRLSLCFFFFLVWWFVVLLICFWYFTDYFCFVALFCVCERETGNFRFQFIICFLFSILWSSLYVWRWFRLWIKRIFVWLSGCRIYLIIELYAVKQNPYKSDNFLKENIFKMNPFKVKSNLSIKKTNWKNWISSTKKNKSIKMHH